MSRSRRHVLLIARNFPPSAAVSSRRALRFARGLSECGWRVSVITTRDRFQPHVDTSSVEELEQGYHVIRTATAAPSAMYQAHRSATSSAGEPQSSPDSIAMPGEQVPPRTRLTRRVLAGLHRLLIAPMRPDEDLGWVPFAVAAALRLHRQAPIDAVVSTAPPYSVLLAGALVSRRTGAALIADYRDPWAAVRTQNRRLWRIGRAVEQWQEQKVLACSALNLFTSRSARDFYRERFPSMGRSEILLNGIDAYLPPVGPLPEAPLSWTHAGYLYGGKRSLAPVLRAMAKLREELESKLLLIGVDSQAELSLVESLGLEDRVQRLGRMSREETMKLCRRSHRLVAVISPEHFFSIPAKIFDYLSTSRPILLLCDPSHAAAEILKDMPAHRVIAPDDEAAIEALLKEDADKLARGVGLEDVDPEQSRSFESAQQMRQLSEWLTELTG